MAKESTKKSNRKTTTSKKSKPKQIKEDSLLDIFGVKNREFWVFIPGLLLFLTSILMMVAFCSYLYSGIPDYSLVDHPTLESIADADRQTHNLCGSLGALTANFFIRDGFGWAAFIIPVLIGLAGVKLMKAYQVRLLRWFVMLGILMLWLSVFLAFGYGMFASPDSLYNPGGAHGQAIADILQRTVGRTGLFVVLLLTAIIYLSYLSSKTIELVRKALHPDISSFLRKNNSDDTIGAEDEDDDDADSDEEDEEEDDEEVDAGPQIIRFDAEGNIIPDKPAPSAGGDQTQTDEGGEGIASRFDQVAAAATGQQPASGKNEAGQAHGKPADDGFTITTAETEMGNGDIEHGDINTPLDPKRSLSFYKYPPLNLLNGSNDKQQSVDFDEQKENKERIKKVLQDFGVEISTITATVGPTVTLFEITPAPGVRISKIKNLDNDIALSLAAEGIRIIAPIPGKGTIGIEVPNKKKNIVSMRSVLSSKAFQETKMELPCALGKTITNEVYMIDLAKAPHLLVAGATGMGKSVGLNAIVTSLLYKKHPSELKIVMVDPKKVEFSIYSPIERQFMAKLEDEEDAVITDVQKVVKTLKSLCQLMDHRYDLLKMAGVRNIKEYNEKFINRRLNPEKGHDFMPYIVVIIDEFGDLIMTAGKEIELPIARIAQKARAAGIHLILATQRPSVDVITGLIKANVPTRIAFQVSSKVDSRTILDQTGAETLLGLGDMLYLPPGTGLPKRVHGAFVSDDEVTKVVSFLKQQGEPDYIDGILEGNDEEGGVEGDGYASDDGESDEKYDEAVAIVLKNKKASISMVQRHLRIGYNRAARLLEQMERSGLVSPMKSNGTRDVIVPASSDAP